MKFEEALKAMRDGQAITDGDVVLRPEEKIKDLNLLMSMQVDWTVVDSLQENREKSKVQL